MLQKLLRLSNDGSRVYMTVLPEMDKNAPTIEKKHILDWLIDAGVQDFFRFEETIDNVLLKLNNTTNQQQTEPDDVIIAELRDASIKVTKDDDLMSAMIRIDGAFGGKPIKGNDLLEALRLANIVRGVKKPTLQKLLKACQKLKSGEYVEVDIASGKLPIPGEDSKLIYFIQDSKSRVLRPKEREDGTVDMRDLGAMITVNKMQPLAKLIPAKNGIDGFNIAGEILTAEAGKSKAIKLYSGSQFSDDDENVIIAQISGLPILYPDGVEVDNALCLKGVTVATGHINFEGSVVVNGDVQPGMKVQATGSITIGGVVESGILEAGGDIVIHNGILGRQEKSESDITTILKAKGSVVLKFAQYAKIIADGDIIISQHALHCQTYTKSNLQVLDQTKRHGTLSGGVHVANGGIKVLTLGAPSGVHTQVKAFTGLSDIISTTLRIQKELDNEHDQLMKVKNAEIKLMRQPENKRPEELIQRLAWTKTHHFERIADLQAEIETSSVRLTSLYRKHSVEILKTCFPGVYCQIGENALSITREYGSCQLITNGKDVVVEPI